MQLSTGSNLPPQLRLRPYEDDGLVTSRKIGAFCGGGRLAGLKTTPESPRALLRLSRVESMPMRVSSHQTASSRALRILDGAFQRSKLSA